MEENIPASIGTLYTLLILHISCYITLHRYIYCIQRSIYMYTWYSPSSPLDLTSPNRRDRDKKLKEVLKY